MVKKRDLIIPYFSASLSDKAILSESLVMAKKMLELSKELSEFRERENLKAADETMLSAARAVFHKRGDVEEMRIIMQELLEMLDIPEDDSDDSLGRFFWSQWILATCSELV